MTKKLVLSFISLAILYNCAYAQMLGGPGFDAPLGVMSMAGVNDALVKTGMNSLNKRLGDLRRTPYDSNYAIWARGMYKDFSRTGDLDIDMDIYGGEIGVDFRVFKDSEDRYYFGVMGGYLKGDDIAIKDKWTPSYYNQKSKGEASAFSVGLYGTWLKQDGWFVDIAVRQFFTDIESATYQNGIQVTDKVSNDWSITALSAEAGKEIRFEQSETSAFLIEPKVKAMFAYTPSKSADAGPGSKLHYGSSTSLLGRAGVLLAYSKTLKEYKVIEPYIDLGANYELDGKTKLTQPGRSYKYDLSGFNFDVGGGFNMQINRNLSIYSYLGYEKGSDLQNYMANAGIRYILGKKKAQEAYVEPSPAPIPQPVVVTERKLKVLADIDNTHFEFNKYEINPKYNDYYDKAAKEIIEYGNAVEVHGHTDIIGSAEYNQKLSELRAKAVHDKLIERGVPAKQISYKGYGFTQLLTKEKGKAANALNRRVEVVAVNTPVE